MTRSRSGRGSRLRLAAWLAACLLPLQAAEPAHALEAGDAAPLFSLPRLDGEGDLALSAYRGTVVYLDFWASWCPPCLTSLPLLDSLRREFPEDRFQVVAINLDADSEVARRFLAKLGVGFPSGLDPAGETPERFEVETMPTSFLIDASGVIRHVHEGFRKGDVASLRQKIGALVASEAGER
jgi:thiol-disulfide isomerase/thioredoxin